MRKGSQREAGASLIMVAAALFLLLGVTAFVVDLSALRLDRAVDQKVADLAATAGAITVFTSGAEAGCETALGYVELNAPGMGTLSTAGCSTVFSSSCDESTARTYAQTVGRFTVSVVNPVTDGHDLMDPTSLGATGQTQVAEDGEPCERLGVEVSAVHEAFVSQMLGADQGQTSVHAVARADLPEPAGTPINLLLLDRFGCQVLHTEGNGGVIVDAIFNPDTGALDPGVGAVDSDGSNYGTPCDPDGTIDVDGDNSLIRADGPEGCDEQVGTDIHLSSGLTKGLGCGTVQTLAPGTPGCGGGGANLPACSPGAGGANPPIPDPTALPERLTRAPIDHRYNCRGDYEVVPSGAGWATDPLTAANEQDIPGCSGGDPNIHELILEIGELGTPTGYDTWQMAGHPCDVPASYGPITLTGDWRVDCDTFNVRTPLTFEGNVVFDGDVNVTSTGHLTMEDPSGPVIVFFRDGLFQKDGQAFLTMVDVTVYLSKTSSVRMAGGDTQGLLTWTAPNIDGYDFDDLALWSDSPLSHEWQGQANLEMSGVFFTPLAMVDYAGTGGQNQTDAQFIADKLLARGQGQLVVAPVHGHSVDFNPPPASVLLR